MVPYENPCCEALRAVALALPETTEGTSCVNRAFKVGKKTFLFLGEKPDGQCRVMVKLQPSLDAATALDDPRVSVGRSGWVTMNFPADAAPDHAVLAAWIRESWSLFAPSRLR